MSKDSNQDRLLDHSYDGIQEYDNPLPGWWLLLFYATIAFAVLYWLNLPGIGTGRGRVANYERDMAAFRDKYRAAAPAPAMGDPELAALVADPARLAEGKAAFDATCSPCHRADGGGVIGPNLTDDFWIHGSRPAQILGTIVNGVPDKGMPAWGQVLKPEQLPAVAAYVLSLRGTHPPNPKEPQGTKSDSMPTTTP
jgi:cytochrome c oxidase cbb3-type subunit 3